MQRISIVGNSGTGKTTMAREIAGALGIPHLELDGLHHLPNWEPIERELFRERVAEFIAGDAWVVDGNYSAVQDLIWHRADTVVWLDLPRRTVMRQLLPRTLRRLVTREQLWNGNTESWRDMLSLDPTRSIVLWAWTEHRKYVERYTQAQRDPANRHLTFFRVRSRIDRERLVAELAVQAPVGGAAAE